MPIVETLAASLLMGCATCVGIRVWRQIQARRGTVLTFADRGLTTGGHWQLATDQLILADDIVELHSVALSDVHAWLLNKKGAWPSGERRDDIRLTASAVRGLVIEDAVAVPEPGGRNGDSLGALVTSPPGGAQDVVLMGFDLTEGADHRAVVARQDGDVVWTTQPYFTVSDIALGDHESIAVAVISKTGADTVRWRIEFTVRVEGRVRRLVYPAKNEPPLVTSGVTRAEQYWMTGLAGLGAAPWVRAVDCQEFRGILP